MNKEIKEKFWDITLIIAMFIIGYYAGAIISADRAQKERENKKPLSTYEEYLSWQEEEMNSRDTISIIEDGIAECGMYEVCITTYNPVKEQCDDNPLITADGSHIDLEKLNNGELKWCAISQDLLWLLDKGITKIKIESAEYPELNGIYEIHDTMNIRHKNCIDLLYPIGKRGGKWNNVWVQVMRG